MGVTLAFQDDGTCPVWREKLKRLQRGTDRGTASSFSSLLLIEAGPTALPTFKEFKVSWTSSCVIITELSVFVFSRVVARSDV